eukprot:Clim_evm6s202 gene=Clim_evmTU6s202
MSTQWWQPTPGGLWNYVLQGEDRYEPVLDVIDIDPALIETADFERIHGQGARIICYFSAGTKEDYRPDASDFPASDVGNNLPDYPNEQYVDIRSAAILNIMKDRMDSFATMNCDGVEADNVDVYSNDSGFNISQQDAVTYVTELANYAHSKNMAFALKNAPELISSVLSVCDMAVVEECKQFGFCNEFDPFISSNKPVYSVEYTGNGSGVCPTLLGKTFSGIIKSVDLTEFPLTVCAQNPGAVDTDDLSPDTVGNDFLEFNGGSSPMASLWFTICIPLLSSFVLFY